MDALGEEMFSCIQKSTSLCRSSVIKKSHKKDKLEDIPKRKSKINQKKQPQKHPNKPPPRIDPDELELL